MKRSLACFGLVALVAGVAFVLTIHDVLATNQPVEADILVVEGWVYAHPAIAEAAEEFKRGKYRLLITVGLPTARKGNEIGQESSSVLAAKQLQSLGVQYSDIVTLPVPEVSNHQTYASALTVKKWLKKLEVAPKGINVFTIGPHARKSLVLFTRALGASCPIGVIAGTEDSYDPERWWLSVKGIYTVLRKAIGYLYAEWWPLQDDLLTSPA